MMRITEINFFSLCILISLVFIITPTTAQNRHIIISGVVYNRETKTLIPHAGVKLLNSTLGSETDKKGRYELMVPAIKHISLQASCLGYKKEVKEIDLSEVKDTITIYFYLKPELYELNPFTINGTLRPDTVFGSNQFSIIDFDFFEDKYILLTVDKKTDKPFIRLADEGRHILSSFPLPKEGGQVKELYHDFLGYTNIICKDAIYRVKIKNDLINLASLPVEDYNSLIKPVIDTINSQLLFSDYDPEFPMFSYYSYNYRDSSRKKITEVEDEDLMHAYRFEYYSMKPKDRLTARSLAYDYGIDKHKAAAIISGFTRSMFYAPLYAPLYIIGDTISVFDHYKDKLFHFDKSGKKIDSVNINYHHPKNWREWKNIMLKDYTDNQIYALYNSNGHKYMKRISYRTGKEEGRYKIIHHSAEKTKVRDGYIYYVYRPFESSQEKFLYKERITLSSK